MGAKYIFNGRVKGVEEHEVGRAWGWEKRMRKGKESEIARRYMEEIR